MKKLINLAFIYGMTAIAFGVFYREFTKILGFTGRTTLAFTHLHLMVMGSLFFLIISLFALHTNLMEQKRFKTFLVCYNIGLPFMVAMLTVRGVLQVLGTPLSKGLSAAISGISGIAHTIVTVALVMLFLSLRNISLKEHAKA